MNNKYKSKIYIKDLPSFKTLKFYLAIISILNNNLITNI